MITAAEIKFVRSLSEKKNRTEHRLFVAEGSKLISDLYNTSLRVDTAYVLESTFVDLRYGDEVVVSPKEMGRMSSLKTASDAIALIEIPTAADLSFEGLSIILDGVQDPGNLGTIIRTADWFGIKRIICSPNCADCYSSKVVQATMGSIARVEIYYMELEPMLSRAASQGIPIFGTFLEGENIYSQQLPQDAIIVMGSEGRGVTDDVAEKINNKLYIPPFNPEGDHCESLNVAVATAIICSEFRRKI